MIAQTVTPADLQPAGWSCEQCGRWFQVGDTAFGEPLFITSDGTGVEGNWRCAECADDKETGDA